MLLNVERRLHEPVTTVVPRTGRQNAIESAKQYLAISGFSRNGLIQQLESDAGDGYTYAQAVYGVGQAGL
jgi:hypothetical protein